MTTSRALWTVAKGKMSLLTESLPPATAGSATLRAIYSGVSRGTERLVLDGAVPASETERMRCPFQEGEFPFPVKYGYNCVGKVIDGPPHLTGRRAFALSPHQDTARLPAEALLPLPANLPTRRAVLAANAETALNVLWDAEVRPGDRVLVVGAGVVGLLVAYFAAKAPGAEVWIADANPAKATAARNLGLVFVAPPDGPDDVDVAINASASGAGLRYAIAKAGLEARVVEASWHGDRDVSLALGEAFHARRLAIVSSQVGRIPPRQAPRWNHRRRLAKALDLLAAAPALDALITHELPFAAAADHLPELLAADADALCVALRY